MTAKRGARILEVISSKRITPNMQRLTLGGPEMDGFPEGHESANFKLLLPRPGQHLPLMDSDASQLADEDKPIVRTYTVRKYHACRNELEVDFALHEHPGPATSWALGASPGDKLGFKGPGRPKPVNLEADWVLLAGDMSALPAISALLELLPVDSRGHALLEVISEADKQQLDHPQGVELSWLVNPEPTSPNTILSDAVKNLPWLEGRAAAWIAGESAMARDLRQYCKQERGMDKSFLYASGYWQIGLTEDKHQIVKRQEQ